MKEVFLMNIAYPLYKANKYVFEKKILKIKTIYIILLKMEFIILLLNSYLKAQRSKEQGNNSLER